MATSDNNRILINAKMLSNCTKQKVEMTYEVRKLPGLYSGTGKIQACLIIRTGLNSVTAAYELMFAKLRDSSSKSTEMWRSFLRFRRGISRC